MSAKFEKLIDRLDNKVSMSMTPVTSFFVGLSGTDSIVTYILLNEVNNRRLTSKKFDVFGVYYKRPRTNPSVVTRVLFPWLQERYPLFSHVEEATQIVGPMDTDDQYRWADLHAQAAIGRGWVVSTTNATEKALGTYSIMSKSASIAPIMSLYKSEVIEICREYDVPEELVARSSVPDCACGRDEFAAENIRLIDDVLRYNLSREYTAAEIRNAMDYVREKKRDNDFKNRTPYGV